MQKTSIWLGLALAVQCSLSLSQSTSKELFMGTDGTSTQIRSKAASDQPVKPVNPKVLGLQTTVYQLFEDGGVKAVSPNTVFSSGNRIRLGFNANRAGFLYVINVGSSGKVTTVFPSSMTDNNQVQPGLIYQIPQQTGKSMRFDATPGEDLLLVVLAESRVSQFSFQGQMIAVDSPRAPGVAPVGGQQQRLALVSSDMASTSKDLFVEDDGVFQTAVLRPESVSGPTASKQPLVVPIRLAHK